MSRKINSKINSKIKNESIVGELIFGYGIITDTSMSETLQNSESFILQWWNEYYERWYGVRLCSYKEAVAVRGKVMKEVGKNVRWRIIKEAVKQEVICGDKN